MTIEKKNNMCDPNFWKTAGGKKMLLDVVTKEDVDNGEFTPTMNFFKGEKDEQTFNSDE